MRRLRTSRSWTRLSLPILSPRMWFFSGTLLFYLPSCIWLFLSFLNLHPQLSLWRMSCQNGGWLRRFFSGGTDSGHSSLMVSVVVVIIVHGGHNIYRFHGIGGRSIVHLFHQPINCPVVAVTNGGCCNRLSWETKHCCCIYSPFSFNVSGQCKTITFLGRPVYPDQLPPLTRFRFPHDFASVCGNTVNFLYWDFNLTLFFFPTSVCSVMFSVSSRRVSWSSGVTGGWPYIY